jgi:flavin-dependent dehydrogenase
VSRYDAVIIGGGPAGSVCAARLAARGRSAIVLEKGHHPRFHLGESLLPGSVAVLEAIGVLDEVRASFIEKRGARFVQGKGGPSAKAVRYPFAEAFQVECDHAFQVPRDEFDEMLWRRAGACGAEQRDGCEVTRVVFDGKRAVGVDARSEDGTTHSIEGRIVIDATGRDAFLARSGRAVDRIPKLDRTALYTQVRGAWRDQGDGAGDIQIVVFGEGAERGWFWLIPFRDGRTSVGAVVSSAWIRARRDLGGPPELFQAAVTETPTVGWMLEGATQLFPPGAAADFSFRVAQLRGEGWLSIGDSGGFIDPLFSTGAHLAMFGGLKAADVIDSALATGDPTQDHFANWEQLVRAGSELFVGAVQGFYEGDLVDYLFAEPQHPFLRRSITSMLSGYVFGDALWVREMRTRFPPQF